MLVGKIVSHDRFEPKAAMIVQNKDEFKIPMTVETVRMECVAMGHLCF
jgi:hypothetical protein